MRYMSNANRHDFLEFLLLDITNMKRSNIVKRTADLWKKMLDKKQHLESEISRLRLQAGPPGVLCCVANANTLGYKHVSFLAGIDLDQASAHFKERVNNHLDNAIQVQDSDTKRVTEYVKCFAIDSVARSKIEILATGPFTIGEILFKVCCCSALQCAHAFSFVVDLLAPMSTNTHAHTHFISM